MAVNARTIVEEVTELVEPVLEDLGFEVVDVVYASKSGRWVLQLFIDKQGGVTIDDCASVSREIGDLLDVHDIIPSEYVLEVSSPGLDRPLKRRKDFRWATGRTVKIRTLEPKEGRRNFTGRLDRLEGDVLTLLVNGAEVSLSLEDVEKANLVYEF